MENAIDYTYIAETRDLEALQTDVGKFPGRFLIKVDGYSLYDRDRWPRIYRGLEQELVSGMFRSFGVTVGTQTRRIGWDYFTMLPEIPREEDPSKRYINVEALSDFSNHVRLRHGRMYSATAQSSVP